MRDEILIMAELKDFNTDELLEHFFEDFRELVLRRSQADGIERVRLDATYNRAFPYFCQIQQAREGKDISLLGLIATAGQIIQKGMKE